MHRTLHHMTLEERTEGGRRRSGGGEPEELCLRRDRRSGRRAGAVRLEYGKRVTLLLIWMGGRECRWLLECLSRGGRKGC